MITHYIEELRQTSQRVLLLQGPIGGFFSELAQWLQKQGKSLFKINFNAGDEYFYPNETPNTYAYRASLAEFPFYLEQFVEQNQIDTIICFGDNRFYHKKAKVIANRRHCRFWVFEEGYFRPHFVTLEQGGVNDFSPLPRHAQFFLSQAAHMTEPPVPKPLAKGFFPLAKLAITYYWKAYSNRRHYPKYKHHRRLAPSYYLRLWGVSGVKRLCYWMHDFNFATRVECGDFGDFYIVPLQVYDDSQIKVHSDYHSVADFLGEVLQSFAEHAPAHTQLIVKHHPMDRGLIDYQKEIDHYLKLYPSLAGRVHYIHDVPMPVFLRHGKGMITVNSTSGISALLHKMPVITLGRAHYDMAGLTYQGELKHFWHELTAPDMTLFTAYRLYHLNKTQINGSFYSHVQLPE